MKKQWSYQVYLLRCWQESCTIQDTPVWRFSLEGVRDGQRQGFADLQALHTYLQQLTQVKNESTSAGVSFQ